MWSGLSVAAHRRVTFLIAMVRKRANTAVCVYAWRHIWQYFRMLSLDAEIQETSPDVSIAKAHQISAGDRKDSSSSCWNRKRPSASTKLHTAPYDCPVYIMISEGHWNDIIFAISVPEHIKESSVPGERGYDSNKLTYTTAAVSDDYFRKRRKIPVPLCLAAL